jgi:TM2 domain-containing membrane protein YozV
MALSELQKRRIEEEERQTRQIRATAELLQANQKYGMPALLSFFIPGLGQLVKGQVGKGILIFLSVVIGLICLVIPGVIIWIWQVADAYNKKPS